MTSRTGSSDLSLTITTMIVNHGRWNGGDPTGNGRAEGKAWRMAALGMMNHLALTLSDLRTSEKVFYQPVLEFLGYSKLEDGEEMTLWWSDRAGSGVTLWQADPELAAIPHQRYAPGFHHFAFSAESREQVDRLHDRLREIGATVLDPPAEYPYMPGYYAVFFAAPDGLKFELVHIPPARPLVE